MRKWLLVGIREGYGLIGRTSIQKAGLKLVRVDLDYRIVAA